MAADVGLVVGALLVGVDMGAEGVGADEVGAVVALVDEDAVGDEKADEEVVGLGLPDVLGECTAGDGRWPRAGSRGLGETACLPAGASSKAASIGGVLSEGGRCHARGLCPAPPHPSGGPLRRTA
ncbi:MAG: hypothetical protein WB797_08330 [Nocardioides sp.]